MTTYTKTTWLDNNPPDIDDTNLNKIEQGIYDAHVEIGDLTSLTTTVKTDLVSAINELDVDIGVLDSEIGTLSSLTTTVKTDLVSAINELDSEIGTLSSLTTTATSDLVSAINELDLEKLQIISSNTTLYIDDSGSDATGDGSTGNPWLTPHKFFDYMKNKWINDDVTVTLYVKNGTYALGSGFTINHPCINRIKILGESEAGAVLDFSSSSSEGVTILGNLLEINELTIQSDNTGIGLYIIDSYVDKIGPNITIQDFDTGVKTENSIILIDGGTVYSNASRGIYGVYGSTIVLTDVDTNNNGDAGVSLIYSSTAQVKGNSNSNNNTNYGYYATRDCFIDVSASTGGATGNGTANYSPAKGTTNDVWGNINSFIWG